MGVVVEELPELGLSRISRWCFNCYLISGDNGSLVVVDAGMPTTADDLEPVLERTPGVLRAVTAALST
ncbi:MAG TPA: hypothetical protein VLZ05_09880 [Mycobacterium sp.]|nr:hypothetical protein [Mycobacterium sp.]HUH69149.1 hypothetical protein [Mycobacterium sp.]